MEREELRGIIGRFGFEVEPFQEDATGALSWAVLCNLLLRCASKHAGQLGFGYRDMIAQEHVWVLARLVVEVDQMPVSAEVFGIETWFAGAYRQFADRNYLLLDESGEPWGRASSVWSLIHTESRMPADMQALGGEKFSACTVKRELELGRAAKIKVKQRTETVHERVMYSDLDINGHLNSVRYITKAMDVFGAKYHRHHRLSRVEVSYSAEAMAGEELVYSIDQASDFVFHIEVVRGGPPSSAGFADESLCRMALTYEPIV